MTQQKSIYEICEEYSAALVAAQHARNERIREITAMRRPSGDQFLIDRLDDGERRKLLEEQKAALAEEDRRPRGFLRPIPNAFGCVVRSMTPCSWAISATVAELASSPHHPPKCTSGVGHTSGKSDRPLRHFSPRIRLR